MNLDEIYNIRSINECICHGIPDMRPLQNGDLCNGNLKFEFF